MKWELVTLNWNLYPCELYSFSESYKVNKRYGRQIKNRATKGSVSWWNIVVIQVLSVTRTLLRRCYT